MVTRYSNLIILNKNGLTAGEVEAKVMAIEINIVRKY